MLAQEDLIRRVIKRLAIIIIITIIPLNIRSRKNLKGHLGGEDTAACRSGLIWLKHRADRCFFLYPYVKRGG